MELNKVFIIGNLTRDPESRFLPSGSQVCQMRIAANRRRSGGRNEEGGSGGGDKKEEVLFIDVEAWNKTAELCAQYLQRGSQILVEGRLKMDQYQAQSGEQKTKFVIVAERVQFGARPGAAGTDTQDQSGGGERRPPARRAPQQAPSAAEGSARYDSGDEGHTEDDLPF